jgi:hypothetical protein
MLIRVYHKNSEALALRQRIIRLECVSHVLVTDIGPLIPSRQDLR